MVWDSVFFAMIFVGLARPWLPAGMRRETPRGAFAPYKWDAYQSCCLDYK